MRVWIEEEERREGGEDRSKGKWRKEKNDALLVQVHECKCFNRMLLLFIWSFLTHYD